MEELRNKSGKTEQEIIESNKKLGMNEDGSGVGTAVELMQYEDPHFYYVILADDGVLEFRDKPNRNPFPYEINRIKNKLDLLNVIDYLLTNHGGWITGKHIKQLINIVYKNKKWKQNIW